tara:strand:- start:917 stop:1375 length:459 start_codon:yes stop_codon:yes gene_type:complete
MLIDDNKVDLFVSQKVIEKTSMNFNIRSFISSSSALNFLKILDGELSYPTMSIPDIILLDINMPEMNGFQFLSEFKKLKNNKFNNVKIYMLSSSTNFQDIIKIKDESQILGFINKPLTVENLNQILINFKPYLKEYDYLSEDVNSNIFKKTP